VLSPYVLSSYVLNCYVPSSLCAEGHARAVERAADTLHRAWVTSKAFGNLSNALSAIGRPESGKDSLFQLSGYPRSPQPLARFLGPLKASSDSFPNHRALKLGKNI
jgi:hypothetical protein